jgi:hypothetical protein
MCAWAGRATTARAEARGGGECWRRVAWWGGGGGRASGNLPERGVGGAGASASSPAPRPPAPPSRPARTPPPPPLPLASVPGHRGGVAASRCLRRRTRGTPTGMGGGGFRRATPDPLNRSTPPPPLCGGGAYSLGVWQEGGGRGILRISTLFLSHPTPLLSPTRARAARNVGNAATADPPPPPYTTYCSGGRAGGRVLAPPAARPPALHPSSSPRHPNFSSLRASTPPPVRGACERARSWLRHPPTPPGGRMPRRQRGVRRGIRRRVAGWGGD